MKENTKIFSVILATLFLVVLIATQTKAATYQEATTPSNVTVNVFVEISLSSNLTAGILFGTADPDTDDNNATGDFNVTDLMTQYWVTAGAANTASIDLCIKDSANLTQSTTIPNTGYTYNFTATNDDSNPLLPGTAITTSYFKTQQTSLAANDVSYSRYWLDIPSGQAPGVYSNTVYIKGIETGESC